MLPFAVPPPYGEREAPMLYFISAVAMIGLAEYLYSCHAVPIKIAMPRIKRERRTVS